MLDPIKVSLLSPGMGEDGKLEKTGVPAALVNAWFNRFGIVPTRVTDFQVMFLFSIGITQGQMGHAAHQPAGFQARLRREPPVVAVAAGDRRAVSRPLSAIVGLHDLGDELFEYLRENRPATC